MQPSATGVGPAAHRGLAPRRRSDLRARAGEVVVDYSRRLKRMLADDHPWPIGYAYEVPCYIPSARLVKEGGYETESSMIYYGLYGPFRGGIEMQLLSRLEMLVSRARTGP